MMRLENGQQSQIFRANTLAGTIVLLTLIIGLPRDIYGQDLMPRQQRELLASVPKSLPGDVLLQIRPLGARMQVPGKEETVLTGQLIDAAGNPKDVRIVHQISGMVRIEGLRANAIAFDGDFARGFADRTDESLLETFAMDTVEGLIYAVRSGGAVRLLGRHFGPTTKNYTGPYYDIFEVIAPVRLRSDRQLRTKRYYFDSQSKFLVSTRYSDPTLSPPIKVDTRFSNWQQVEGSAYPGRIERYENDRLVFSLIMTAASSRARQSVENFR